MTTVILVPFRTDHGARERNWRFAQWKWEELRWPIFVGDSEGEFNRSAARNAASKLAGDWSLALIVDADIVLASIEQAQEAIMLARSGAFVAAHDEVRYLTEMGTKQAVNGRALERCQHDGHPVGMTWESAIAIRRDVWDAIGGYDERFQGWGQQGIAFMLAASRVSKKSRVSGIAYHLAHPGTWGDKDLSHERENTLLMKEYE